METLKSKPVTDDHPQELVTASNAQTLQRGWTLEDVRREGDILAVSALITDAGLIAKIESGKQELSCGYQCDTDDSPGRYQGVDYQAIQKNIRYNHLAVVARGRAGPEVRLRLDASEEIIEQEIPLMAKIKLDSLEVEIPNDVAAIVAAKIRKDEMSMEEMETRINDLTAKVEGLMGEKAALDSELETEKEKSKDAMSEEKMDSLVKERIELLNVAQKILVAGTVKLDSMSAQEIKVACVKAKYPALDCSKASADYVNGMFNVVAQNANVVEVKKDSAENVSVTTLESARAKSRADSLNAWKVK
jgi:hypothetical protein